MVVMTEINKLKEGMGYDHNESNWIDMTMIDRYRCGPDNWNLKLTWQMTDWYRCGPNSNWIDKMNDRSI